MARAPAVVLTLLAVHLSLHSCRLSETSPPPLQDDTLSPPARSSPSSGHAVRKGPTPRHRYAPRPRPPPSGLTAARLSELVPLYDELGEWHLADYDQLVKIHPLTSKGKALAYILAAGSGAANSSEETGATPPPQNGAAGDAERPPAARAEVNKGSANIHSDEATAPDEETAEHVIDHSKSISTKYDRSGKHDNEATQHRLALHIESDREDHHYSRKNHEEGDGVTAEATGESRVGGGSDADTTYNVNDEVTRVSHSRSDESIAEVVDGDTGLDADEYDSLIHDIDGDVSDNESEGNISKASEQILIDEPNSNSSYLKTYKHASQIEGDEDDSEETVAHPPRAQAETGGEQSGGTDDNDYMYSRGGGGGGGGGSDDVYIEDEETGLHLSQAEHATSSSSSNVDNKVAPRELVAVRDTAGRDAAGRDAAGKGAAGWDTARRDVAGRDTAGRDTAGRDASGKNAAGKDTAGRDVAGKDVVGVDTAGRDAAERDTAGWDAAGVGARKLYKLSFIFNR